MTKRSIATLYRMAHAVCFILTGSAVASGCTALPPEAEELREAGLTETESALNVDNGLTTNGLTTNGLTTNGLTTNGLTTNGLTTSGLADTTFLTWFDLNGASTSNMVMRYVTRCALAEGQSLSWTHPLTGQSYQWNGGLGLAPGWAGGQSATTEEQQLVSACLAAHVNAYGQNVEISLLGRTAANVELPVAPGELSTWSVREGCFFGNLAAGEGIFSGSDRVSPASESSLRACALSTQLPGLTGTCSPMVYVGQCSDYCTLDATGTFYEQCVYNGRAYRPLTTRVKPADVYTCGDGVCQATEHCGTGGVPSSCEADCGRCLL